MIDFCRTKPITARCVATGFLSHIAPLPDNIIDEIAAQLRVCQHRPSEAAALRIKRQFLGEIAIITNRVIGSTSAVPFLGKVFHDAEVEDAKSWITED